MTTPRSAITIASLIVATLVACKAPEGQEWRPTVGITTAIVDSYEFEVEALGYVGYTGDVDYSMTQIELGGTLLSPGDERPLKHQFAGISLGSGDLSDSTGKADLTEISGGGNFYFDEGKKVIPFLSIWSTISDLDDSTLDPQLGFRFGGGLEYVVSDVAAVSFSGDYLFPLVEAEDSAGLVSANTSGLAFRIGFRIML